MTNLFATVDDLALFTFRITDNGGRTADRYTVTFNDGDYLGMSGSPTHPQGFSMWGETIDVAFQQLAVENGTEVDLALGDLPQHILQHVLSRCNEGFRDFLELIENKDPNHVGANRNSVAPNEGLCSSAGEGIYLVGEQFMVRADGAAEDDAGPFVTAREALLATLPTEYSLSGPEYHSSLDVNRTAPDADTSSAVAALEASVDAAYSQQSPV